MPVDSASFRGLKAPAPSGGKVYNCSTKGAKATTGPAFVVAHPSKIGKGRPPAFVIWLTKARTLGVPPANPGLLVAVVFDDQTGASLARQVGPHPLNQYAQPQIGCGKELDVDCCPYQPSHETA